MQPTTTDTDRITARLLTDPSCPYAYSINPALRTLEWRYRDQIEWSLVTIGLSETGRPSQTVPWDLRAGFLAEQRDRHGMPFTVEEKARPTTSSRACKAIIAARLIQPGSEWRVLRALQLMEFNTPILLDEDDHLLAALESVEGLDPLRVVLAIDTPEVQDAYDADRAESRGAASGPAQMQLRTVESPEGIRYTAPSVIFSRGDRRFEIGGFQPVEAYDVAIANLDPGLNRTGPPAGPLEVLRLYPGGLVTQEVAAIMAHHLDRPARKETESLLLDLVAQGKARRIPLGNDAIWLATRLEQGRRAE